MDDLLEFARVIPDLGLAALDLGVKYHFKTMMTLGSFQFCVDEAAYQSFQRTLSWRWGEQQRFGQMDSLQYVGQAVPVISFSGEVFTDRRRVSVRPQEWAIGTAPVREMSLIGDTRTPQLLISGIGEILGYWVVTDFSDTADRFLMAGLPKHQQFTMTIKYYGENIYDAGGGYAG